MPDLVRHPPGRMLVSGWFAARWTPDQVRGDGGGGRSPYPSGASIDLGGVLNHCGPASVMWKQSSIRTPNLPGV